MVNKKVSASGWNTNDEDNEYDDNEEDDDWKEEGKKIYTQGISLYHLMLLQLASGNPHQEPRWQYSPNSVIV